MAAKKRITARSAQAAPRIPKSTIDKACLRLAMHACSGAPDHTVSAHQGRMLQIASDFGCSHLYVEAATKAACDLLDRLEVEFADGGHRAVMTMPRAEMRHG